MDRPLEEQCTSRPAHRAATDEGESPRVAEDDVDPSGLSAPSFERFFRAEADSLLRMCWLLTLDREAASDIAQETMTRAWSSWDSLSQPDANPAGWCRTVAANLARSRWRRLQRVARRPRPAVVPAPAAVGDPALLAVDPPPGSVIRPDAAWRFLSARGCARSDGGGRSIGAETCVLIGAHAFAHCAG